MYNWRVFWFLTVLCPDVVLNWFSLFTRALKKLIAIYPLAFLNGFIKIFAHLHFLVLFFARKLVFSEVVLLVQSLDWSQKEFVQVVLLGSQTLRLYF